MAQVTMEEFNKLQRDVNKVMSLVEELMTKKKDIETKLRDEKERSETIHKRMRSIEDFISNGFLTEVREFKLGEGDLSIKMDRQGLWIGKNTYDEAIADNDLDTGPDGTAISIDGTLYAKDGETGTIVIPQGTGSTTVTVTNGIITNIV